MTPIMFVDRRDTTPNILSVALQGNRIWKLALRDRICQNWVPSHRVTTREQRLLPTRFRDQRARTTVRRRSNLLMNGCRRFVGETNSLRDHRGRK